ncbi:Testis-expressed sequence 264 protein [Oryzias melastigma]|uniref:Testis-expressed sequence 264 protein n=1 Tax=Oryzias melastigma TaxID=30732 RepID=A0A834CEJ5_ORYME|nr:Testis-expressed sequence 264 protein [Oryzias melastigma]
MMSDWFSLCTAGFLLCLFTFSYVVYSGYFTKVSLRTGPPPIKRITFAYKFTTATYWKCGPLYWEASKLGPKLQLIGVFYNDPSKVPGKLCCFAVGSILSEEDSQIDMELLRKYEAADFKIFSFPGAVHAVTTSFPNRTHLSWFFKMTKVYPCLEKYIKERRLWAYPFMEIYKDGQIQFMAPLDRQMDFYVPEFRLAYRRLPEREESDSSSDVSGAESNSEDSSESGVLLSDSRETSLAASSVRVQARVDSRGRSDRESSDTPDREEEENEHQRGDSKHLEVPTQPWTGAAGGEE